MASKRGCEVGGKAAMGVVNWMRFGDSGNVQELVQFAAPAVFPVEMAQGPVGWRGRTGCVRKRGENNLPPPKKRKEKKGFFLFFEIEKRVWGQADLK